MTTIAAPSMNPISESTGMPATRGLSSVVHKIDEAINSAAAISANATFWTIPNRILPSESEGLRSSLIRVSFLE